MASFTGGRIQLIFTIIAIHQSVSQICDNGWKSQGSSCFYVETGKGNNALSWHEARERCQSMGADLAVPKTREEAQFLEQMSKDHDSGFHASLWLGLNNREDFDTWKFVNGDIFTGADNWKELWMWAFPRNDNTQRCAYQLHTTSNICFNQVTGIDYVTSVIESPVAAGSDMKNSWLLGMLYNPTDNDCEVCEQWCHDQEGCELYTFFTELANADWAKYCIGLRRNFTGWTGVTRPWTCSGMRTECYADGYWHNDNCGVNRGYACQKPVGGGTVPAPQPTPAVPGFCPFGFYEYGNKCFMIGFLWGSDRGYAWRDAKKKCEELSGVGLEPTLASFHSEAEMAAVTMHLNDRHSFWTGLYREVDNQHWVWTDNSRFDFNKAKYPLQNTGSFACAEMQTVPGPIGTWSGADCATQKGYICQTLKDPDNTIMWTDPPMTPSQCGENQIGYRLACYQQLRDHLQWHDAENECKKIGAHLVSIADGAENAAMVFHFTKLLDRNDGLWIGFNPDIDGEWSFTDDYPVGYTNWAAGQPTQPTSNQCGVILSDGSWKSTPCNSVAYRPLCKLNFAPVPTHPTKVEGTCPDESWHHFGEHCYWFSDQRKGFDDAQKDCSDKNSRMLSIHSMEENQMIFKQFSQNWNTGVWLGRKQFRKDLPFRWTDSSPDQFLKYKNQYEPENGNGTKMCVAMTTTKEFQVGYWFAAGCATTYKYTCKTKKEVKPTSTSPTVPSGGSTTTVPGSPTGEAQTGNQGGDGGLSGGAIAGIIVGVVLAAGLIGAVVWYALRRSGSPAGSFGGGTTSANAGNGTAFENPMHYDNTKTEGGSSA